MKRKQILAHRGIWKSKTEQNSIQALESALSEGFGIETDLRDFKNDLAVSHDPVRNHTSVNTFKYLAKKILDKKFSDICFALNIKADGLLSLFEKSFQDKLVDLENYFFFDMSIPDHVLYCRKKYRTLSRISEYENNLSIFKTNEGYWIDSFTARFDQIKEVEKIYKKDKIFVVVSSELHNRDPEELWFNLKKSRMHKQENVMVCTDYPHELLAFME